MSSPHTPARLAGLAVFATSALLAACGGGGGTSAGGGGGITTPATNPPATATPVPTATPTSVSTQQVITMALPSTAMGSLTVTGLGLIGGYTQALYSQTLAFAPGSQVMIQNGQAATTPHTFNVLSTAAFPAAGAAIDGTSSNSTTIDSAFRTGTVNPTVAVGPFTLAAGTYYIGCAFHYTTDTMRTQLVVAAGATPSAQATPPSPTQTAPPKGLGY